MLPGYGSRHSLPTCTCCRNTPCGTTRNPHALKESRSGAALSSGLPRQIIASQRGLRTPWRSTPASRDQTRPLPPPPASASPTRSSCARWESATSSREHSHHDAGWRRQHVCAEDQRRGGNGDGNAIAQGAAGSTASRRGPSPNKPKPRRGQRPSHVARSSHFPVVGSMMQRQRGISDRTRRR